LQNGRAAFGLSEARVSAHPLPSDEEFDSWLLATGSWLLTPDFACIAHKSSMIYERCRLPDTIGPKIIIAFSTRFSR
jgi:hypothetical protein